MKTQDFIKNLPIQKLVVWRRLSDGKRIRVGQLASTPQGLFFQYDTSYLNNSFNLSPFMLQFNSSLQQIPHKGSVFDDALPDGWGLLLIDRWFEARNFLSQSTSSLDKLALISSHAMGALSFEPCVEFNTSPPSSKQLIHLSQSIEHIYTGQRTQALEQLLAGGSAAGMRPKIQVYLDEHNKITSAHPNTTQHAHTQQTNAQQTNLQQANAQQTYLLKFTSSRLPLQHEESLCEAAYLKLATQAGIECCQWKLIPAHSQPLVAQAPQRSVPQPSRAQPEMAQPTEAQSERSHALEAQERFWLALKRFDCSPEGGRYHMHSLAGLMGVNFRLPVVDYQDLIRVSMQLCQQPSVGHEQFRRAVFNLFALNHDDHAKNWSFLQNDHGQWRLAPFYDITHSPSPHGEHMCSFAGHGKQPPVSALQALASQANFSSWPQAQKLIQQVVQAVSCWPQVARELGISPQRRKLIAQNLNQAYQDNKQLLEAP